MGLVYRGDGVFVDDDPVDLKDALPKDWSPALKDVKVYWLVEHPSPYRTWLTLAIIKGSPKKGKIQDFVNIKTDEWTDPFAPLMDLNEATFQVHRGGRHGFEEYPYVDVESEVQYKLVIQPQGTGPKDWSPKKNEGFWDGPGIYDFRDQYPTKAYPSLDAYELAGMEERTRQLLDEVFDADYKDKLKKLVTEYAGGRS